MTVTDRSASVWVELADRNLAEFARLAALWSSQGEVSIRGDLQLVASGTRFPAGMFNSAQALGAAPDAARARASLEQALSFFVARKRGFSVYIRGERDAALASACEALGMTQGGAPPGMLLAAPVPEPELPPDVRIELVTDAQGIADLAGVAAAGFALHGLPDTVAQHCFADPERVLTPELTCYVSYLGDRPAGCAMSLLSHGIAGLYWIATHPELHRRGLGSAITRRASNEAFAAGAARVILQASAHGEPVYRRLGYRTITPYRWYFITAEQAEKRAS